MNVNPFLTSPNPELFYLTDSLSATLEKVRYVVENRQGLTVVYPESPLTWEMLARVQLRIAKRSPSDAPLALRAARAAAEKAIAAHGGDASKLAADLQDAMKK